MGAQYEYQYNFLTYLSHFFLEWEMVRMKFLEKSKHTFCVQ